MGTGDKLRGEVAPPRREATPEELKAMAHPLRLRILRACLHDALSNKEIADRLGQDPATTLHHVRLLVRTGFLEPGDVRTGARGAREKPYRATGKTWILSITDPSQSLRSELAVIDAVREEVAAAMATDHQNLVHNTRLGLRLDTARLAELDQRLQDLVREFAAAPDDPDGDRYGMLITLHRLR